MTGSPVQRACRVVVTGGAGFIGSHLVDLLLAEGHSVTCVDNFATGRSQNIDQHAGNPRFCLVRADVSDLAAILPAFRGAEWVFHLAALADIVASIERPLDYHRSNVDGTAAVLEAARQSGVQRLIYAASSSCYGLAETFPTPETAPIRPVYPYALTKYIGEQYVLHWSQVYRLPCVSLRLFNVFGPRARTTGTYGAVFGVFLAQKLAGKPLTVVGDGRQTRDFTFVTDVARAFLQAARHSVAGEVFNIGSGGTYSVNSLVALLDGEIVQIPKRPGEPDCTFADTRKAAAVLGWTPLVRFDDGVRMMLRHIDEWWDAPVWDTESIARATERWFAYLGPGRATS